MGVGRDLHGRRRDGSEFPVEVGLNPIETAEGRTVVASIIDITERKKVANLQAAVEVAEAATRAKSDFLATMSHELRTPISGILGAIDLLRNDPSEEDHRVLLDALQTSAVTLSTVVGDILDFSKIEAGHIGLEAIDFDVREVVRGAIHTAGSVAVSRGLELDLTWPGEAAHIVRGDPTRLRQVLSNLVDNALKFTIQGGVSVRVDPPDGAESDRWLFSVRDTGIGIDAEARKRLFAPFTQADESTTRRFGGTGLGLAICRRLVEAMGGRIGVESNVGEGSVFWFRVLLVPGDARMTATVPALNPFRPATRSLHVLLAEDNAVSQLLVGKLLERMGHIVTCVDNGRKALEAVSAGAFDAVVMDMQMPEMDGIQATKRIRELRGEAARVPIIALTADALVQHRPMYEAAGLSDFLTKPVDPGTLRAALDRLHETVERPPFQRSGAFDEARIAMLRDALGEEDVVELLRTFADNVCERLGAARLALDTGDRVTLEQNTHAIKGAAANIGASEVATDALDLERAIVGDGELHGPFERMAEGIELAVNAARKASSGRSD
jgi:signal transduction histidine kinase/CheY-like chemotaxis protein/HPt (histidine-containing phosphotransfer) domain-containing protein